MNEINIILTVDTEPSIGGAFREPSLRPVGLEKRIFGKVGEKEFGIRFLMKVAESYGLRLSFFLEALSHIYFGLDPIRETVEAILTRSHDVQLHIHPNYQNFKLGESRELRFSDFMHAYSTKDQAALLEEGISVLMTAGASRPVAFRAGCYGGNAATIEALGKKGLLIDCSYNAAFVGCECGFEPLGINDVKELAAGVYELPVTNFWERGMAPGRLRPLDINGAGFGEIKAALEQLRVGGTQCAMVVLHSFSFIKPYDVQYRKVRIRHNVIRRFRNLCEFLSENSGVYRVRTLGELTREELKRMSLNARHFFPKVPVLSSFYRMAEQAWDRFV